MGGERWLLLKSVKEAERLRTYLSPLDGDIIVGDSGCWLEWTSPCRLEVGYSASAYSTEIADIVSREICRRFGVTRIGAAAVGWYQDKDWLSDHPRGAPTRYGKYTNWVSWMKDYCAAFSVWWGRYPDDYLQDEWEALEQPVVEAFSKLDEGT